MLQRSSSFDSTFLLYIHFFSVSFLQRACYSTICYSTSRRFGSKIFFLLILAMAKRTEFTLCDLKKYFFYIHHDLLKHNPFHSSCEKIISFSLIHNNHFANCLLMIYENQLCTFILGCNSCNCLFR